MFTMLTPFSVFFCSFVWPIFSSVIIFLLPEGLSFKISCSAKRLVVISFSFYIWKVFILLHLWNLLLLCIASYIDRFFISFYTFKAVTSLSFHLHCFTKDICWHSYLCSSACNMSFFNPSDYFFFTLSLFEGNLIMLCLPLFFFMSRVWGSVSFFFYIYFSVPLE